MFIIHMFGFLLITYKILKFILFTIKETHGYIRTKF